MSVHAKSGHPDWYVDALIERYQYYVDEMNNQKSQRLFNLGTTFLAVLFALLAYLSFETIRASILFFAVVVVIRWLAIQVKLYFIAFQMLNIEAEFPHVRENVAIPKQK